MAWKFNPFTGRLDATALTANDLSDISIVSAILHQHLEYDGTNWVNVTDLTNDGHIYLKAGKKLYFDA